MGEFKASILWIQLLCTEREEKKISGWGCSRYIYNSSLKWGDIPDMCCPISDRARNMSLTCKHSTDDDNQHCSDRSGEFLMFSGLVFLIH